MIKLKLIKPEKIEEVKSLLKKGVGIRETARISKVSYYVTWHISKGNYEKLSDLRDAFRKKNKSEYFDWETCKVY